MDLEESQWRKHVPVVAVTLAIVALLFAVMVLYPWHIQLSSDIAAVSRQISRIR
jgi:NADH:ubiquinone oxidoreductase subunit 6 (subunit J)